MTLKAAAKRKCEQRVSLYVEDDEMKVSARMKELFLIARH